MRVRWPVRFVADGVFAVHKPAGLLCGALLSVRVCGCACVHVALTRTLRMHSG
jgi:hypothetical protein